MAILKQLWLKVLIINFFVFITLFNIYADEDILNHSYKRGAEYAKKGASACIKCHDDTKTLAILRTPHAQIVDVRTPFASHQCETCHGPSPEHFVKPEEGKRREPPQIVFGVESATPVTKQNRVCLGCHKGGRLMHWNGSQHETSDISCVSCHTVHSVNDKSLNKILQQNVCYKCHTEQLAQSHRRSRHPIKEGKVTCSDCHESHGSFAPQLLTKNTLNETCYSCHSEKRGPFLWEHPPVMEDCGICHMSHGSNQQWLLKVRPPFLCQMCHLTSSHTNNLFTGNDRRIVSKGCINCHSKVHGSNHPSGARLLR